MITPPLLVVNKIEHCQFKVYCSVLSCNCITILTTAVKSKQYKVWIEM